MLHKSFIKHFKKIPSLLAITTLVAFAQACTSLDKDDSVRIGANNPAIQYSGRSEGTGTSRVTLGYSGARVRLRFQGTSVGINLKDDSGENYAMVWIDGEAGAKFRLNSKDDFYTLAEGLEQGEHTVEVVRITECNFGLTHFNGFVLNKGAKALEWKDAHKRKIEFIGDSITCGYGVEANDPNLHFDAATENFCLGYSALAARELDADYLVVSRSGIGIVRNYDGPFEGSDNTMPEVYPHTFYLQSKPDWDYTLFTPDVVCINLGTNDFSTSGVNVDKFVSSYVDFAKMILTRYPEAKLMLIQGPMNNSEDLKDALTLVVNQLSKAFPERVSYFELSAQGSVGLGADYHPNRAQSKINAAELSKSLSDLMGWK